jgi:hypothetical protein
VVLEIDADLERGREGGSGCHCKARNPGEKKNTHLKTPFE